MFIKAIVKVFKLAPSSLTYDFVQKIVLSK
jgi:hypothetical protein